MESDLPLIEIAGEDDSLLQPTIALDDGNSPYFSCSPLQFPISEVLKDSADLVNPSCSNKENINTSKLEGPNLSMEPLQMKRKKKGKGYNLRKSLAWDKAFFTDEGVLDPFELSMISGTYGNSCGEALSVISEEGRNSFSGHPDRSTDSAQLQAFEGNSSARANVTHTSVATRKVISTNASSRIESKGGGCPRPLASSSLKRPANVNTVRAAKKDSKLTKLPISNPGPGSLPTTTKSTILSASHLKHNQIAQPAVSVQKNIGLKSSSQIVKGFQNKAKPGPSYLPSPAKVAPQHSRREMANSPLEETHSSTNARPQSVSKANSCLKAISDRVVPSTKADSLEGLDGSAAAAVSLPQNTRNMSKNMKNVKIQTAKPSGLRMPSPSLGFFSQPKASGSHTLSQKPSQLFKSSESSISGLKKHSDLRPPRVPGKNSKSVNDITASAYTGVSSSSTQCSDSSVPRKNMKFESEVNTVQNVEVKIPYNCKHEVDDIVDANRAIQEHVEHNELEKIFHKEDAELHANDNQVREDTRATVCSGSKNYSRNDLGNPLSVSLDSCVMDVTSVTGTEGTIEDQHVEEKFRSSSVINLGAISKSCLGDSTNHGGQKSLTMSDDNLSCMQCLDQPSREEDELISCTLKSDWAFLGDSQSLNTKDSISKSLEESQKCRTGNNRSVDICSGSESSNFCVPFQHEYTDQEDGATSGVDNLTNDSAVGVASLPGPTEILLVGNCNSNPSTSNEDIHYLKVDDFSEQCGEHLAVKSLHLSIEQNSLYNLNFSLDDHQLHANCIYPEESLVGEVIESVLESNDGSNNELRCSKVFMTHVPSRVRDDGEDMHKLAEIPLLEAQLGTVETDSSVQNHEHSIDAHFEHGVKLIGEATSLEFDAFLREESGLFVQSAQIMLNGSNVQGMEADNLKNDVDVEEAETKKSENNFHKKSQRLGTSAGSLFKESTMGEESHKYNLDNVIEMGCSHSPSQFQNAEQSDVHRSDPKGPNVPEMIESEFDLDKMDDQPHVEDASSVSVQIGSSAKILDYFNGRQFGHETVLIGPAISVEIDSALKINKDRVPDVITTSKQNCYSEENGLLVEEDQTSTRRSSLVGIGVDEQKIFPGETETKIPPDGISPISELHHELNSARCPANDNDATESIKRPVNGTKQDNLMIKPPPDAVPFSEEWLAAIEAAGEDLLTMKSGAVQNSPPDKSLPEPGPWSPVKRKNNQIGPFDCTKKVTNVPPSDSP